MALRWSWKNKMGEMTITQQDLDGETNNFRINIYHGNCLAVFIYECKNAEGKEMYDIYSFFVDKQHAKRMAKECPTLFWDKVKSIKLNLAFKECETLAKLLTKAGHKVTCYYKEIKD